MTWSELGPVTGLLWLPVGQYFGNILGKHLSNQAVIYSDLFVNLIIEKKVNDKHQKYLFNFCSSGNIKME